MTVSDVLGRLEKVKPNGSGWKARCPAHEDRKPSLSVSEGPDGRVLLNCFAGCSPDAITAAIGLQTKDLFADDLLPPRRGLTVAELATLKRLPEPFLRELGLTDSADHKGKNAVVIPYRDRDGEVTGRKTRTGDGWFWEKGRPLMPYGLDRLAALSEDRSVLLVEGESDAWTAWHHGIDGVLGIPGANAWKSEWAALLDGRDVYAWQEPDAGGKQFIQKIQRDIPELRVIRAPDGVKDLSELHIRHPETFRDRLRELGANAKRKKIGAIVGWRRRGAVPLSELYESPETSSPMKWVLHPYIAVGHISLLTAPPKAGKSTWMGLFADAIAKGGEFMGQRLQPGRVLIVPLDESWNAVVRRHRALGTPGDRVLVWFDPIPSIEGIAEKAAEFGADVVISDTLGRIAPIADENDNAAWTRWFTENDHHMRDSGAGWLFSHHDRKSGGTDGTGIRGASAIFGCVDMAFSLRRRDESKTQRVVRMEGTRFDQPDDLVIELDGDTYKAIGDLRTVSVLDDGELMRVLEFLGADAAKVSDIQKAMDAAGDAPPHGSLYRLLDKLVACKLAVRDGAGGRSDPYRYATVQPSSYRGVDERTVDRPPIDSVYGRLDSDTEAKGKQQDTPSTPSGRSRLSNRPASRMWTDGRSLELDVEADLDRALGAG